MKKAIKCCCLLIAMLIGSLCHFTVSTVSAIEIMPDTYISYPEFYEQVNINNDKVEITVIGNYDFETLFSLKNEEGNVCNSFDLSKKIQKKSDYFFKPAKKSVKGNLKAIVVSCDEVNKSEGKEKIEDALDKGYFAVFMIDDLNTADAIFMEYAESQVSTMNVDDKDETNPVPYACYVVKNNIGEYFTGTFYGNKDVTKSKKDETILYHMWCLKDIHFYTKNTEVFTKQVNQALIKQSEDSFFGISASAENGNAFSIGSAWKSICGGWHQNVYGQDPSFWEWSNFLYLTDGESGNHYYAWAVEYSANPCDTWYTSRATDYVEYESDASMFMPQGKLRSHYPTMTPQSGSYSYSFGAEISEKGEASANIGYSRTVSTSDLEIIDTTDVNYGKIKFNYKFGTLGSYTDYAKNTSTNNAIFIYKDESKCGHYTFHHYRKARFFTGVLSETYSGNYYSTFNNHTCAPSSTWNHDSSQHWHNCTTNWCPVKYSVGNHSYGTGTSCTTCGRTHSHSASSSWSYSTSQHWKTCTVAGCSYKFNLGNHSFDSGCKCSTCGYKK